MLINIDSSEPFYYPFFVSVNKCGGSCSTVDHPSNLCSRQGKKYECKSI